MIILGLDPGLANTGWGVIQSNRGRLKYIAHGAIVTSSKEDYGVRLKIIYDSIGEIIQKYQPIYAGIENLYFAKNKKSAMPVAQARGILLLLLCQNNIFAGELTPMQIKQAVTGSGRSAKIEVQALVKILLGMKEIPKPDHSADALAAAIAFDINRELFIGKLHV